MNSPIDFEERKKQLVEYSNSPEYQQDCRFFQAECSRLTSVAERLHPSLAELEAYCITHTNRMEFASGSDLHRGFYCPSPVFDLIVGNTHRGRILKRVTKRSKPSHGYSFDSDGTLLKCEYYFNGSTAMTEYLNRENNSVFGITVDQSNRLESVTEEVYDQGRIRRYLFGLFVPVGGSEQCCDVTCEEYRYDDTGLCGCVVHHFLQPLSPIPDFLKGPFDELVQHPFYKRREYLFQCSDGCLCSYSIGGHQYEIQPPRKV